jgi:hypothetical protein
MSTQDEIDAEEWVRDIAKKVRYAPNLKAAVTILEDALDEVLTEDLEEYEPEITIVFAGEKQKVN